MRNGSRPGGFAVVALVVLVAIIGIAAACAIKLGSVRERRAREAQLLEVGNAFSEALSSYAEATPRGGQREPMALEDLVRDPRFPGVRRHLRKIFADPLTGRAEWGIVQSERAAGIIGVYSLAPGRPVKTGNFDPAHEDFAGKTSYRDWIFGPDQARARALERGGAGRFRSPLEHAGTEPDPDAGNPALPQGADSADAPHVSPMQAQSR
jgi:type II secretory pathway pseudopilin PulG